jgi:hypothetical protein
VSSHDRTRTTTPPGAFPYIDVIRADLLFADPVYQRDLDPKRVTKMIHDFDQRLVGVLEVSARADGRFAILDGQHRWAAICQAHPYGTNAHLACQIHTGLTVEEEAHLYYELDTKRKNLSWWERWRARRGTGDPAVLAIEEVLTRHNLQVHPSAIDGNLRATKAIETIVTQLGELQMLDNVLVVLTSAYGRAFDAFDGALMQGVALVLGNYDLDELDLDRLVTQLTDIPPRQLRARAASMREAHRGTLPRLCAAVIVERYNSARGAAASMTSSPVCPPPRRPVSLTTAARDSAPRSAAGRNATATTSPGNAASRPACAAPTRRRRSRPPRRRRTRSPAPSRTPATPPGRSATRLPRPTTTASGWSTRSTSTPASRSCTPTPTAPPPPG